ncbi:MAG TPA: MarR family transcriptional regulator, partial [Trueperaceae bacterium]
MQSPPPDPPAQLTPAFRFLVGFWKIGQGLGDYLNPLLEDRYDLSLRDYLVLNTIHWGVHYPTELAKRLKMSKDMTSRIIHKLLEAGLLERSIDEEDSRRTRLVASGDGQRRREEIEQTIET